MASRGAHNPAVEKRVKSAPTNKRCNFCHEVKPAERFSKKKESPDGLRTKCKDCHNAYVREHWYPKNQGKQRKSASEWKKRNRFKNIGARYGIPESDVKAVFERSGNVCEICSSSEDLCLDHCHSTGRARGILCRSCNILIGRLGDNKQSVQDVFPKILNYFDKS